MKQSLLDRINQANENLTDSQHEIASFLLRESHKAAFMNAAEIAVQVSTSESTVVRFARALGFGGFPDMQNFLRESLLESLSLPQRLRLNEPTDGNEALHNRLLEIEIANLRSALENVDTAVLEALARNLWSGKRKYIVGLRSSRIPARLLGHLLEKIMPDVTVFSTVEDLLRGWQWLDAADVVVAFSFPRYSMPTLQALQKAKEIGAFTTAITDSPTAPPAASGHPSLIAPSSSTFFTNSFVASVALCNLLITCCVRMQPEAALENLNQSEASSVFKGAFYEKQEL